MKTIDINLPASKSISNRLLILNRLCFDAAKILNLSEADDTKLLQFVLNEINIKKELYSFNLKNAGTTYRFLTSFLSTLDGSYELLCDDRMKKRPIDELVDALLSIGANIKYIENKGFPPLKINGKKISGGEVTLSSQKSSQFISSLLLVAPFFKNGLKINIVGEQTSTPYIEMTLKLLNIFGASFTAKENFIFVPSQKLKAPKQISVEADWSASAIWYAFATLFINIEFFLPLLNSNSIQGDSCLLKIYEQLGVNSLFEKEGVKISKISKPKVDYFEQNLKHTPDLMPTLSVNLCLLGIKFKLTGLENLKIKESNRIHAIKECLENFGYIIYTQNSGAIEWKGEKRKIENFSAVLNSYNDHRIAMACSLFSKEKIISINDKTCVEKSYPNFWNEYEKLGI
ncbi:MAG: 3-phosphoshikimate 1-carboxyvinyltransferase [Bacteroidales bacterium]|nr:3-phosphoshikimate 1-carboxyvinyltransferase [Bacteroidales bacterium]